VKFTFDRLEKSLLIPEDTYLADIAVTPDGQALAILHEQILVFSNLETLGSFIDGLKAKKDACFFNMSPLDDQTAKEAATGAINFMEQGAKELSSGGINIQNETIGEAAKGEGMTTITDTIKDFFSEDGWQFSQQDSLLQVPISGTNGKWLCLAQALEERQQFVFYSICPVNAPEPKYREVSEFLTRANYGITIGNFEMNFENGEIRYKTSIDVEGDRLVSSLVKQLVYQNMSTMDNYLPGILNVLYADASPCQAIAQVED